jgi:hypothetical protein
MSFLDRHMDDVKRKSSVNHLSKKKAKKLRSKFIHTIHSKNKIVSECSETHFDRFRKIFFLECRHK